MKVNSPANIQAMLETLRQHETEAKQGIQEHPVGKKEVPKVEFLDAVKSAIGTANDAAIASGIRKTAYEK